MLDAEGSPAGIGRSVGIDRRLGQPTTARSTHTTDHTIARVGSPNRVSGRQPLDQTERAADRRLRRQQAAGGLLRPEAPGPEGPAQLRPQLRLAPALGLRRGLVQALPET